MWVVCSFESSAAATIFWDLPLFCFSESRLHEGNGNAQKFSLSLRDLYLSRVKFGEDTALSSLNLPGAVTSHSSKGKKASALPTGI